VKYFRAGPGGVRAATLLCACLATLVAGGSIGRAQESQKTVAAGVYSDTQATRGALIYETSCSGCHRADLGGASAPALKEQRFARDFAGKDLKTLFTKISTTMPNNAPGSLGEAVYLDVLAHVLKENGFPAGSKDLAVEGLEEIQVVAGRPKPPPPVGDYSYVEVVGCLMPGPHDTWLLTRATPPVSVTPPAVPSAVSTPTPRPLGTETFNLVDALAYAPDSHKGHKMYVRGLLIRLPGEQRMTISSFDMLAPSCSE
jgi:cytochrome c5